MGKYTIVVNDLTKVDQESESFEYYPAIDPEDFMSLNEDAITSLKPIDLWEVLCRLYEVWLRENYESVIDDFNLYN